MKQYKYVVVRAGSDPQGGQRCRDAASGEPVELSALFESGWKPVRECPMGVGARSDQGVSAYAMILLQYDSAD
jgi:hypothetical protein